MMYALAPLVFLANVLSVARPVPDIAPTKTATRPGGSCCKDRFDVRMSSNLTMMTMCALKEFYTNAEGWREVFESFYTGAADSQVIRELLELTHANVRFWFRTPIPAF